MRLYRKHNIFKLVIAADLWVPFILKRTLHTYLVKIKFEITV